MPALSAISDMVTEAMPRSAARAAVVESTASRTSRRCVSMVPLQSFGIRLEPYPNLSVLSACRSTHSADHLSCSVGGTYPLMAVASPRASAGACIIRMNARNLPMNPIAISTYRTSIPSISPEPTGARVPPLHAHRRGARAAQRRRRRRPCGACGSSLSVPCGSSPSSANRVLLSQGAAAPSFRRAVDAGRR